MKLRALSRRSFLIRVTANVMVAGGALGVVAGETSRAQPGRGGAASTPQSRRMVVDADPADPARSGTTDSDSGSPADPLGNGRQSLPPGSPAPPAPSAPRRPRATGVTNSDPGDPRGQGRTGVTNSDPTDPPQYGLRRYGGPPRPTIVPAPQQRIVICPGNRRCPR
jgi:hypothetical protein